MASPPFPVRLYWETPLCFITLAVAPLSFIAIKNWSIKNRKFRQILYLSAACSLAISAVWSVEIILVFFGCESASSWWIFHIFRFWLSLLSMRMMMFIFYILVFILLKKLSMSKVKVAGLLLASILLSSISMGEIVYMLVKYPLLSESGQYSIDITSPDLKGDLLVKIWDGAMTISGFVELLLLLGSFVYVKFLISRDRALLQKPLVRCAINMLRRLIPVFFSYYLPAAFINLLLFVNILLPKEWFPAISVIRRVVQIYDYTIIAWFPLMIKWAIKAPPPVTRRGRRSRRRTIVAVPPTSVLQEGDDIRTVLGASEPDVAINIPLANLPSSTADVVVAELENPEEEEEEQVEEEEEEEEAEEGETGSTLEYFRRMEAEAAGYFAAVFRFPTNALAHVPARGERNDVVGGQERQSFDSDLDFEALSDSGLGGGGDQERGIEMDDLFRDAPPEGDIFPPGLW